MISFLTWQTLLEFDIVIKIVIAIIVMMSMFSWTVFLHKFFLLNYVQRNNKKFLQKKTNLLMKSDGKMKSNSILQALQKKCVEYFENCIKNVGNVNKNLLLKEIELHMQDKSQQIIMQIESNIVHLATIASITPFIGLFGTVWGIMNTFHVMGDLSQNSINTILPTISEALFVTALGLLTAIPAIIFYNKLVRDMQKIKSDLHHFSTKMLLEIEKRNFN